METGSRKQHRSKWAKLSESIQCINDLQHIYCSGDKGFPAGYPAERTKRMFYVPIICALIFASWQHFTKCSAPRKAASPLSKHTSEEEMISFHYTLQVGTGVSVCLRCQQQHIWQSWRRHVTFASSARPDSQGLMTWKETQSLYIWAPPPVCHTYLCTYECAQSPRVSQSTPLLRSLSVCLRVRFVLLRWCLCVSVPMAAWDLFSSSESPSASGPVVLPASRVIRTGHADQ